jgi:aldose 1-epimerase
MEEICFYTLSSSISALELTVTSYGARVEALKVPDRTGRLRDIALGFSDTTGYLADDACFGGVLGRNANRIANAQFELEGHRYRLTANEGVNSNHSGPDGYEKRQWNVTEQTESSVTFSLHSPEGDQGFPGALDVSATYRLVGESQLELVINGEASETTVFNPTTHTYFNLDGTEGPIGTVEQHKVSIAASKYCPTDERTYIPKGAAPVEGTAMDLRNPTQLGIALDTARAELGIEHGFNHAFLVDEFNPKVQELRTIATVSSPATGIAMSIESDAPAVLLYSADYLNGIAGKYGAVYGPRAGLCLEPGFVPNAINEPSQVQPILPANTSFSQRTRYRFSTD